MRTDSEVFGRPYLNHSQKWYGLIVPTEMSLTEYRMPFKLNEDGEWRYAPCSMKYAKCHT